MERAQGSASGTGQRIALVVLAGLLLAAVVWIIVLLNAPGGTTGAPSPAPTQTAAPTAPTATPTATGSATPAPSGSGTPGRDGLPSAEAANVVWPDPRGGVEYAEPLAAATGFAEDLAGFTDPIIGAFMQGDSRSGEVEVRAAKDGPATTVLVRQMSDGNWYTIGATTSEIDVASPRAAETIESPVTVEGRARAFEGNVLVYVFGWDSTEPLGRGHVTGSGGPDLGPFSGDIEFEESAAPRGALLLTIPSAKDGSVWVVAALPIGL